MPIDPLLDIDPFAIALEKKKAESPAPSPVENPIEKNRKIETNPTIEIESNFDSEIDFDEPIQQSKSINKKIEKQKPIARNYQLGMKIQDKHGKMLKRYAFQHDLFIAEVLERAIENLVNEKNRKIDRTYKELDYQDDDVGNDEENHHRVRQFYENLTGQAWERKDSIVYNEVRHLGEDQVIGLMRVVHARAPGSIANFSYFVTGIKKELASGGAVQGREAMRKRYREHLRNIQQAYVGGNLSPSDLAYKLRLKVTGEGMTWNDDLANEVMAGK